MRIILSREDGAARAETGHHDAPPGPSAPCRPGVNGEMVHNTPSNFSDSNENEYLTS